MILRKIIIYFLLSVIRFFYIVFPLNIESAIELMYSIDGPEINIHVLN